MIPLGVLGSAHVPAAGDPLAGFSWEWRFESDSITGVADGDPVETWPDLSGHTGRDATQFTVGLRPIFDADAFGSMPGLTFGGSGTDRKLTTASAGSIAQPFTYFIVGWVTGADQYLMDGILVGSRHSVFRSASGHFMNSGTSLATNSFTTPGVHAFIFNGASSRHWANGGTPSTTGNAGTQAITGLTIGNRFNLSQSCGGAMGAVLATKAAMSSADMNTVGSYLATKYGYTWTGIT